MKYLRIIICLVFYTSYSTAQFFDNFETYISGQPLVCQNPIDWISIPCDPTLDPFISSNYALSGTNSVVMVQNNDVVKLLGNQNSGLRYINFNIYIPNGKAGYFNIWSGYPPDPIELALECYLDVGGVGHLMNVPGAPIQFVYQNNSWFRLELIVDLNLDQSELWIDNVLILSWQWTQGGTNTLRLAANEFFGVTANNEMYIDDYWFADYPVPVELTSFTAIENNGIVELNWETATEVNNRMFEIQRQSRGTELFTIGFVNGHGTTTEPQFYSFTDESLQHGKYQYRLKQIDLDGSYEYSSIVEIVIETPKEFSLEQNYPNPFNPSTRIEFIVPANVIESETKKFQLVTLKVYDVLGNEIATLVNEEKPAGSYDVKFDASQLSSGIYFYKLKAGSFVGTKKMLLLK